MKYCIVPQIPDSNQKEVAIPLLSAFGLSERKAKDLATEIYQAMLDVAPPPPRGRLPKFQGRLHEMITEYIDEHGVSPTLAELAKMTGKNKSTILRACRAMQDRHVLTMGKKWRGIILLVRPGEHVPLTKRLRPVLEQA